MSNWHEIQDLQITDHLHKVDAIYNHDSPLRRIYGILDSLLMEKHLFNVFVLKKRDEPFRLLDLGCGGGELLYRLAMFYKNAEFVGLDSNQECILMAKSFAMPKCQFIQARFEEGLNLGEFDVVVCSEVFEHVFANEKLLDVLAVLVKKGGFLSISTPSGWMFRNPFYLYNWLRAITRPQRFLRYNLRPERHWEEAVQRHPAIQPGKLIRMLALRGFVLQCRQSSIWWVSDKYLMEKGLLYRLVRWLEQKDKIRPGILFHNVISLLEAVMNVCPLLRCFESRFVLLLKRR